MAAATAPWYHPPSRMGFVDLHCHLPWGVDDGFDTPGETIATARLLVALHPGRILTGEALP